MDTYKLKFTTLQLEILRYFYMKTGQKLSQRKLSLLLKVTPTAVANSLKDLKKADFVKIDKHPEMNLNLIELNRENPLVIGLKRAENIKLLYECGLPRYLKENHPGSTIVLFGSYVRGEDLHTSDIDIAIIESKKKKVSLSRFEEKLGKTININYYSSFKKINKELQENICNGLVLVGGLEL